MLSRRGRSPLGRGPIFSPPDFAEEPQRTTRVLPRTPVYPAGSDVASGDGTEEPDTVKRNILRLMLDRKFHSDEELAKETSHAEVLSAIGEILADGYAFDRVGRRLRLRARGISERPQDVGILVCGLYPSDFGEAYLAEAASEEAVPEEASSEEVSEAKSEVSVFGRGLVLSDPPDHLTVPIEHLGSLASVILAKRGVGKTYLGHVIVEEFLGVDPPITVVVFDPTGVWWGLGADASGRPSDREILILGGARGHLPITHADGKRLAELVADRVGAGRPARVVADLSEMAPAEQHEFVADFCEMLFTLPQFPIQLVFDEADEFAPQKLGVSGHQRRSLGHVERLVMRGRARGIGATLISLRPAVVSKNVISQVDALYLMRMVEPNDLRAVRGRLENFESGITPEQREQCLGLLPVLPVGTAYFLRGGDPIMFRRFKVRAKGSYDSSRTPVAGEVMHAVLGKPRADLLTAAGKILGKDPR